jgi:hypothetical protein
MGNKDKAGSNRCNALIATDAECDVIAQAAPARLAESTTSTRNVPHVELRSEGFGQLLCGKAAEYVGRAGWRIGHDHAHWPRWIGLCPRDPQHRRQRPRLDARIYGEVVS